MDPPGKLWRSISTIDAIPIRMGRSVGHDGGADGEVRVEQGRKSQTRVDGSKFPWRRYGGNCAIQHGHPVCLPESQLLCMQFRYQTETCRHMLLSTAQKRVRPATTAEQ